MYETMTYEALLSRMLKACPADIDCREGSLIYDAIAPAAAELAAVYTELEGLLKELFPDTASREYLLLHAAERGMTAKEATEAVFRARVIGTEPPLGSRFSLKGSTFLLTEREGSGSVLLKAESPGSAVNSLVGALLPLQTIEGLKSAEIVELVLPGEDEEATEVFRRRFLDSLKTEAFGGNIADYRLKVLAMDGVGGVKVEAAFAGGGTVSITVMASDYGAPTERLIADIKARLDPEETEGQGLGLAPIGHKVTVRGVREKALSVRLKPVLEEGWTLADAEEKIRAALRAYFKELSADWDRKKKLIVRLNPLESRILEVAGLLDLTETLIEGAAGNFTLAADEIPVLGEVTFLE